MKHYPLVNNFTRGELSTRMNGRVDLPDYFNGCRIMHNCIMAPQGGVSKRPGTEYLGEVKAMDDEFSGARLIPFEVNDEAIYVLEMGHLYTRIWDVLSGTVIADLGEGSDELATPYRLNEIYDVQYAISEGKVFLAHENHAFRVIERVWDGTTVEFNLLKYEYIAQKHDGTTGTTYEEGSVVYDATGQYWYANEQTNAIPGVEYWKSYTQGLLGHSPSGDITTYSGGSFAAGDLKIHKGIIYKATKSFTATGEIPSCYPLQGIPTNERWEKGDSQYVWIWNSERECLNRFLGICTSRVSPEDHVKEKYGGDNKKVVILSVSWAWVGYNVDYRIDKLVHDWSEDGEATQFWEPVCGVPPKQNTVYAYDAQATYQEGQAAYSTTTHEMYVCIEQAVQQPLDGGMPWSKHYNPFFSKPGDYPAAVAFLGQRLYLGGSKSHPQTVWGSKVGKYSDFNVGANDDDSLSFTIAAERSSRIKWMIGKDHLMLGTTSSEWLITGGGAPITSTNVQVLKQSAYGSAYSQARFVADTLLFFQKGGRKLREYVYSNDNKTYLANDLTFHADHITLSGVKDSSYQQNPDSILWCAKNDGNLIGLTYDRLNRIAGWHGHSTMGFFESVCSVDGIGDEDELWVIVRRQINGTYKRFVERFYMRTPVDKELAIATDSSKLFSAGNIFGITQIAKNGSNELQVDFTFNGASPGITAEMKIKIVNTGNELFDAKTYQQDVYLDTANTGHFILRALKGGAIITDYPDFTAITEGTVMVVTKTVTGLDHLLGKTVSIKADGAAQTPATVVANVDGAGGVGITLVSWANSIACGLPFEMVLQPMTLNSPDTVGAKKRISSVILYLHESLGGAVGDPNKKMERLKFRESSIPLGMPTPVFTGVKEVTIEADSSEEAVFAVHNSDPFPMTILSLSPGVTTHRG